MKKSKRIVTAQDTLEILKRGFYQNSEGKEVSIRKRQNFAESNTILYTPEELTSLIQNTPESQGDFKTEFVVNDLTTLDSVRDEYQQDQNLICLNFASARNAGGGFLKGSQAQEESIARATGLYPCQLKAEGYYKANRAISTCIYTDHIIYAPQVPILKYEGGELMDVPIFASVITAPAVNTGVVLRNEPENANQVIPRMIQRMDMIFAICKKHQCQTLILGAWGCGVFQNDPKTIADLFHQLLMGKYLNQFKRVVFSVYAKEDRFIKPFQELFFK